MNPIAFFLWALTLIFITLKLVGVICWAWWWVLMPVGGPIVVATVFYIMAISLEWLEWRMASPQKRERIKARRKVKRLFDLLGE